MAVELPLKLPYYTTRDRLPEPLPSVAEIKAASEYLSTKRSNRSLVRVGAHYVVKYGKYLSQVEAENMIFVKQACDLSVPEVYAVFEDDVTTYIIMEFIPGQTLESLWGSLDDKAKDSFVTQLRGQIDNLRQIPSQKYYGQLGGRAYFDEIFSSFIDEEAQIRICGPFETEEQLVEGIVQSYLANKPGSSRAYYLRRALPAVFRDHRPVFTHGDLQRKNIIVGDGNVPVIIDWERAAWYPSCWEYYRTMVSFGEYKDDWHEWVGKFLTEYFHELAWLNLLHFELLY